MDKLLEGEAPALPEPKADIKGTTGKSAVKSNAPNVEQDTDSGDVDDIFPEYNEGDNADTTA